jgi:hypothetical protein
MILITEPDRCAAFIAGVASGIAASAALPQEGQPTN